MSHLSKIRAEVDKEVFNVGRWANEDELDILTKLIKDGGFKVYIECGTANGYSAANAKEAMGEGGVVHTWDLVERPIIPSHHMNSPDLHRHIMDFKVGVGEIIEPINESKFIFLDGEHKNQHPIKDFEAVKLFLNPGDFVVFHDTLGEEACAKACSKVETLFPNWPREDFVTKRGIAVFRVV